MKFEHGRATFSSGKTRAFNQGIVGLGPDDTVSAGFDNYVWDVESGDANASDDPLTPDDLIELADFMIAQWSAFRERTAQRR